MLIMRFGLKIVFWIFGLLLFVVQVCCYICCFLIGIWITQLSDFYHDGVLFFLQGSIPFLKSL